jgi:membrane-associated protein
MDPVTGIAIVDWFLGLLDTWGYLLVTLFTISENLFVIGSFTPGETVVMAAAFLSTPAQGHLLWPLVWICSVIGTVTGSNLSYWFGRRGGRDALLRYAKRFRVDEERIEAAEAYFYLHGSKTVFLSRFAAFFKNFVPVIAGVSKMNLVYFEGWTLLGAITYTSIMCAVGYFVGENFDRALQIGASLGYAGAFLFVAVIVAVLFGRRKLTERRTGRYAEEYELEREVIEACAGCPDDRPGTGEAAEPDL